MDTTDLFDATVHEGIAMGSCVLLDNHELVYAGPLNVAPDAAGKVILLHPEDFGRLKSYVDSRRH
jgi:hypothetical protein